MAERAERCLRGHVIAEVGRDQTGRCNRCKKDATKQAWASRAAEQHAAAQAEREAYRVRVERARAREHARILRAGGPAAVTAAWWELWNHTLETTRFGLCQWAVAETGEPGACTAKTVDVYCFKHNAQADRESARARRLKDLR